MQIPSSGSYFHLQGGMRIKRHNTENPVEKEDLINGISMIQDQEAIQILGLLKHSPYLTKKTTKKSIYEIYADAASRSTMTNGFKTKRDKSLFADTRKASISNPGVQPSSDKKGKDHSRTKEFSSQQKSFTNKAIKQRISDNMRIGDVS